MIYAIGQSGFAFVWNAKVQTSIITNFLVRTQLYFQWTLLKQLLGAVVGHASSGWHYITEIHVLNYDHWHSSAWKLTSFAFYYGIYRSTDWTHHTLHFKTDPHHTPNTKTNSHHTSHITHPDWSTSHTKTEPHHKSHTKTDPHHTSHTPRLIPIKHRHKSTSHITYRDWSHHISHIETDPHYISPTETDPQHTSHTDTDPHHKSHIESDPHHIHIFSGIYGLRVYLGYR